MDNRVRMCSRCHKRIAVVFMTRIENGETKQEGLCLVCAKGLGIKPVDDMLEKMGISEEDIDRMSGDIENMLDSMLPDNVGDETEDGGAPAINLPSFFQNMGFPMPNVERRKGGAKGQKKGAEQEKKYKFLDTYCRNLTERAREGKLDAIVGRERELDRVIQILCRRQKNNPCLIGEPGVGKTAIAEALAQRIVKGDVPYRLRGAQIYLVDLTAIVAGTQFRGQFESRILGLINDVKAAGNVILVIDEVHNIVGAGDAEGSMNAANILKPALSRGEIQVIGATTLQEYRKYIEKDSALERRFQPVTVEEPSVADTIRILEGIKHYYEIYHAVRIPTEVVRTAEILSERYITDRFLPDKAIDLLDEAAAHVSLSSADLNERRALVDDMKALAAEKERVEGKLAESEAEAQEGLYKALADIKARELQLSERRGVLDARCEQIALTPTDIADVIEIWTGIPASSIGVDEYERLAGLRARILSRIVGQDEAVDAAVRAIKRKRAGVSYHRAPVSFIFAGPTGVGKTELVKVIAEDLFEQPDSLIRLDMSEYMEKHAVSRIIGAPPGYVGFDEAGQLTEKIRRRPYSVVLFDEIEKAHPDVLNILLQILDDGTVTDAHGKKVNFENTVIVMTTNAGSESASAISGFSVRPDEGAKDKTERALSQFLRPEFLNRVDAVITFRHLSREDFVKIAEIQLGKMKTALAERGITLSYTPEVLGVVAQASYSEKYGARNMRRYIQKEIEDPLAEQMIEHHKDTVTEVSLFVQDGALAIVCR